MDFDFTPYFEKYEKLVAASDASFERVKQAHAECVNVPPDARIAAMRSST